MAIFVDFGVHNKLKLKNITLNCDQIGKLHISVII